jgi:hypothetical protein
MKRLHWYWVRIYDPKSRVEMLIGTQRRDPDHAYSCVKRDLPDVRITDVTRAA